MAMRTGAFLDGGVGVRVVRQVFTKVGREDEDLVLDWGAVSSEQCITCVSSKDEHMCMRGSEATPTSD
jgi:hypothetical protein